MRKSLSEILAERCKEYKPYDLPSVPFDLQSFLYLRIKLGILHSMRAFRGHRYAQILVPHAVRLAHHLLRWGKLVEDEVNRYFDEIRQELEE